jgi:hypothetical protein
LLRKIRKVRNLPTSASGQLHWDRRDKRAEPREFRVGDTIVAELVARPAGLKITSFGAEALFDGMPGFFPARGNAAFQHEISVLHRAFDSGSMAADNSSKRAANRMPGWSSGRASREGPRVCRSPVEGGRFEPSVPLSNEPLPRRGWVFKDRNADVTKALSVSGTEGSNPSPSSGEMVWGRRRGDGTIVAVPN